MPGMSGPDLHRELIASATTNSDRLHHGSRERATRPQLIAQGAVECLLKPFSDTALREALDAALRVR